jgi:putative nucleotidyltransferase with HDIG domain
VAIPTVSGGRYSLTRDELVRRVHEISSLPDVALRVMQVANNPASSAQDLRDAMETDVALSTRILRCVNSSACAARHKITNLQQAIAYLGMRQVRNLAMTASVAELFRRDHQTEHYSRKGLWRHFVAVGICARLIAMRLEVQAFEDAFLAGLLHDVGIVLEDQYAPDAFAEVIRGLPGRESLMQAELAVLGFDHRLFGRDLAMRWQFPQPLIDAIVHHHDSTRYKGEHLPVVQCVEVANFICSIKGMSSVGVNLVQFPGPVLKQMGMGRDDLIVLVQDLDQELAAKQDIFAM